MRTTLRIVRGSQTETAACVDEFVIDVQHGDKVLDALRTIQSRLDPSLSFRWECRSGICGTCAIMVDDKPALSCEAVITPGSTVTVGPLRGFPVEKDLVVDTSPALERLSHVKPYLISDLGQVPRVTKQEADRSKSFRQCIECFACIAAVTPPEEQAYDAQLDPLGIVKLARFDSDPRDIEDRRRVARDLGIRTQGIDAMRKATAVCPKHINIIAAYKRLRLGSQGDK